MPDYDFNVDGQAYTINWSNPQPPQPADFLKIAAGIRGSAAHQQAAFVQPKDPATESAVSDYTKQWLQPGDQSTPRLLLNQAINTPPSGRYSLLPEGLSDVGKIAILRQAWQQAGGGFGTINPAAPPAPPSALQKTAGAVGNALSYPSALVKAGLQPLQNAAANAIAAGGWGYNDRSPRDKAEMERVANLPLLQRASALQGQDLRALAQPDKAAQIAARYQNESFPAQLAESVGMLAVNAATDPLTLATLGTSGLLAKAPLLSRGITGGFLASQALPYIADPSRISQDPAQFVATLPLMALGARHLLSEAPAPLSPPDPNAARPLTLADTPAGYRLPGQPPAPEFLHDPRLSLPVDQSLSPRTGLPLTPDAQLDSSIGRIFATRPPAESSPGLRSTFRPEPSVESSAHGSDTISPGVAPSFTEVPGLADHLASLEAQARASLAARQPVPPAQAESVVPSPELTTPIPQETPAPIRTPTVPREPVDIGLPSREAAETLAQQLRTQFPDSDAQVEMQRGRHVVTVKQGFSTEPASPEVTPTPERSSSTAPVPQSPSPGASGVAYTAANTPVPFHYAALPAEALIASHIDQGTHLTPNPLYDQALQPRDRSRIASLAQVQNLASDLNPQRLGPSATTSDGAPIVGPDRQVESGNARTLAIQRAYGAGDAQAQGYRDYLQQNAQAFGLDPAAVARIERPVLVRVRNAEAAPGERAALAEEMGNASVARMSEVEAAQGDARRLVGSGILPLYRAGADVTSPANTEFTRAFLREVAPAAEHGNLIQPDGTLSAAGQRRVRGALLAAAYEDPHTLSRMLESTDDNTRTVGQALLSAAPKLAQLKQEISAGARYPLDISRDLTEAANKLADLRSKGQPMQTYLAQTGMFGEELSPVGKELLRLFDEYKRSGKKITELLTTYTDVAEKAGDPRNTRLFDDTPDPTPIDALAAAERLVNNGQTQSLAFPDDAQSAGSRNPDAAVPAGTAPATDIAPEHSAGELTPAERKRALLDSRRTEAPANTTEQAAAPAAHSEAVAEAPPSRLDTIEAAARERLQNRPRGLNSGIDPADLADLALIGAVRIAKGAVQFAEFSRQMLTEFGDAIRPHLADLYQQALDHYHSDIAPRFGLPRVDTQAPPSEETLTPPERKAQLLQQRSGQRATQESPQNARMGNQSPSDQNPAETPSTTRDRAKPVSLRPQEASPSRYAANLNLDRMNTPEEVKQHIQQTARAMAQEIEQARGGRISQAETTQAAQELGLNSKQLKVAAPGEGAAYALALRDLLTTQAAKVRDAEQAYRTAPNADNQAALALATKEYQTVLLSAAGHAAEAGRALSQYRMLAGTLRGEPVNVDALFTPKAEPVVPSSREYGASNRLFTRDAADAARQRLRESAGRLSAGLDPTLLKDLATLGGFHLEAGLREFGAWAQAMRKDIGKNVSDDTLREVWGSLKAEAQQRAQATGQTPADVARKLLLSDMRPDSDRIAAKIAALDPHDLAGLSKLMRQEANIPMDQQLLAVRKAGLLSSPRTILKVLASHGIFLAAEEAAKVPAALMDALIATKTGERTVAGPNVAICAQPPKM